MRKLIPVLTTLLMLAATPAHADKWITAWAASVQGPYPSGNATAQPDLRFAFPTPEARDQSFRLVVKPELWGRTMRLRFSNAFGTKPVTFDAAFVGLQVSGAAIMPGSNRTILFGGRKSVTVPPGGQTWSDAVTLPWISNGAAPELLGRKLAVSFHVAGESGPMTWHAKALQTSFATFPGAGALSEIEDETAFPNSTTSWFFLDALDVMAPPETRLVVCFGDSITDGTASTLNGDDRWPDVLARRLRAGGERASVVNAGIGGNQVVGPATYAAGSEVPGGPSALSRLERDVTTLSGVTHVIWLEGINDFSTAGGATVDQVRDGMKAGVARLRAKLPGVKVIAATLTGAAGTSLPSHAGPDVERKRQAFNAFLRDNKGLFDAVVDFDKVVSDPATGALRPEFVPNSTIGGPGDGLHPNRAGYAAMANAIDLQLLADLAPRRAPRPRPPADTAAIPPATPPATSPATGR